ncbi:MAG: lycopene cyclase family protein [Alphaproteobacteria bacterium]|nr:lycopene cyclase family protein [Alphaproteobacteria bacterium]
MTFDVVVVGGGPAAVVAAEACAARGLGTALVLGGDQAWPANYGGWADELEQLGWGAFLGPVWSDALVVLDDRQTRALGRRYARVAKQRLRAHLLARCEALGVVRFDARAEHVRHDARGSTLSLADGVVLRAALVVDATGHRPAFVHRRGEPTTFQAAVGQLVHLDAHPWDAERMTFMDLRTDHVADELGAAAPTFLYVMPTNAQRVFVEETSLVRGPAVPFAVLRDRLRRRLARLDVPAGEVEATEVCLIPMDTPLPDMAQRVVGFGAAASMVHPATGYTLARVLGTAPDLAAAIADGLAAGLAPDALAREAWRALWTEDDLLRRELHLFGSSILASLDADEQRRFFEAFFSMPATHWTSYLAARGDVGGVVRAMASMLVHAGFQIRWKLLRSGTRLPALLLRGVG